MRIAHVIPALVKGGAEKVVVDLANCGVSNGDDVAIILAGPSSPELLACELRHEVEVLHICDHKPGRLSRYAMLTLWLIRNWRRVQPFDVLHCHLSFGSAAATLARCIRRGGARPAIVETFHAVGMPIPPWKRALLAGLAKWRDAVVLVAEDTFWRRFKAENPDVLLTVIPNGIAVHGKPPTPAEIAASRERIGIPSTCRSIVGTLGRLVEERKPEHLIKAFEEISRSASDEVHFVMGGAGPSLGKLEALARKSGLNERIHFPGLVMQPNLLFALCDLYISVNVGPVTGIAGLEAAAFGLPVIALQASDDYPGGATDWIWSSPDSGALGAEALRLLNSPEERRAIADRQRQHVLERHSAQAMSARYAKLYSRTLKRLAG
jgi:glycosyltransferase involved in cell wall biosynthesis